MDMSNESGINAKLDDMFNTSKPPEKNLLDNVSFMTTLSPMPSQNNSLLPGSSVGTRSSQDDVKFLDKIRSKLDEKITEEHEKSNISTLTAFEDQLHEHLKGTGNTAISSTPATEIGTGKVMYGFDLSPAHSLEKKPNISTGPQDNFTDEISTRDSFQKHFEPKAAPNFMQAKVASPRQLRSGKSKINEDTETVMSQVFSSQDVTSSVNVTENKLSQRQSTVPKNEDDKFKRPVTTETKKSKSDTLIDPTKFQQGNLHNYASHSRLPRKNRKPTSAKSKAAKNTVNKTTPVKSVRVSPNVMTPKSPKSRQTAVKVTPKIKATSKSRVTKKQSSSKENIKTSHQQNTMSLQDSSNLLIDSTAFSETDLSFIDKPMSSSISPYPSRAKITSKESAAFIRSLEEIDQMRLQVKEVGEKLDIVNSEKDALVAENQMLAKENDNLKKDNFVMKSKITQFMSKQLNMKNDIPVPDNDNKDSSDEVVRLKEEIAEQDKLISGYQHENERIYADLKEVKQSSKEMESAMYKENLKLQTEIANLQENLERNARMMNDKAGKNHLAPTFPDQKSSNDHSSLKKRIMVLENQVRMEEGLKLKAESSVKRLTEERDEAEKQLRINEFKSNDICDKLRIEHKKEIDKLKYELSDARRSLGNKADALTIRDLTNTPPSKSILSHFQSRVRKLESELEIRDKNSNVAVQLLRDDYNKVKMKYEERIEDLEKQIQDFRKNQDKTNIKKFTSNDNAMEKQLSEALLKLREEKEARETERNVLMSKIQTLQQQKSPNKNEVFPKREINSLKNDCEAKDREIERLMSLLHKTFENGPKKRPQSTSNDRKNNKNEKSTYNPGVFEADGYAGLLEQNSKLKNQLETQALEWKHNKVTSEAYIARLEQETKTMKSEYEKEISLLKNKSHLSDAPKSMWMEQKLEQLQKELDESRRHISELENEVKESSVSRIREQALQVQVQQLVGELHDNNARSPSASTRKVAALENKLRVLEEEFRLKEEKFKKAIISNSSSFMQNEIYKLQEQLDMKNKELTRFRLELDSILLVLREIQSQGVTIPLPQYLQSIF